MAKNSKPDKESQPKSGIRTETAAFEDDIKQSALQ
jgi:hypothetical protein